MKIILALLLLSMAPISRAWAQAAAKPPETAKAQNCPCDDHRFVAKTEKAKAAVAYREARRYYNSAKSVGGIFGLFGIIGQNPQAVYEAQNTIDAAADKLSAARIKAESLGAIKSAPGADREAPATYQLVLGVDYEMAR